MQNTISLSLISHTNVGKTTLAHSLLGHDVGEVRDEAHVTMAAEAYELARTETGDQLVLWDTPGFGDSHRLAQRLSLADNPLGWFLTQVWDRYRERALFASQQAVRNVRDSSDLVLYLVNASEAPEDVSHVDPELQILQWIGKPVIVLLNQLGQPQAQEIERAQLERWQQRIHDVDCVRGVLPLDAFARCWVQEASLLSLVGSNLGEEKQAAFTRLRRAWLNKRRSMFDASVTILSDRLARAASDAEAVSDGHWTQRVRDLIQVIGLGRDDAEHPRQRAMSELAQRLDTDIRTGTDRMIALHGLDGQAAGEILSRLAEHFAVRERLSEGKAAALGAIITGALTGLKADLASGGLTFGAGLLVGGVLGGLGAAGLAHGYNLVRGAGVTRVTWTDKVLNQLVFSGLLSYLAVAHYGRGRGEWSSSEHPAHWHAAIEDCLTEYGQALEHVWHQRRPNEPERISQQVHQLIEDLALSVLQRLYPQANFAQLELTGTEQSIDADSDAGKRPATST